MNKKYFLLGILSVVLLSGCREDYKAEKLFWQASQQYKAAGIADLKDASLEELKPTADSFYNVAKVYPSTPKARESINVVAKIFVSHKHYAAAREALSRLLQIVTVENHIVKALFQTAQLYEAEGLWSEAEEGYWYLAEDYPLNAVGLKAGLKVLQHYKNMSRNDPSHEKEFQTTLVRLNEVYRKLLKKLGPIHSSAFVQQYVASSHLITGEWQKASALLYETALQFPEYEGSPSYLTRAADIHAAHKEFGEAADIYRAYISAYPKDAGYPKTLLKLAGIEREQGLYTEAIAHYEEVAAMEGHETETLAALKLEIAKTYQLGTQWEEAEKILQDVEQNHPETKAVQGVPLLFAAQYYKVGEKEKGDLYLTEAISEYRELQEAARLNPQDVAYYQKLQNVALMQKGDWHGFLANIDEYLAHEETAHKRGQWLFLKALITEQRLEEPDDARSIYKKFIQEFPDHPLVPVAESRQKLLISPVS